VLLLARLGLLVAEPDVERLCELLLLDPFLEQAEDALSRR